MSDLVLSFTIDLYYSDKNAAPVTAQDAGYRHLVVSRWLLEKEVLSLFL